MHGYTSDWQFALQWNVWWWSPPSCLHIEISVFPVWQLFYYRMNILLNLFSPVTPAIVSKEDIQLWTSACWALLLFIPHDTWLVAVFDLLAGITDDKASLLGRLHESGRHTCPWQVSTPPLNCITYSCPLEGPSLVYLPINTQDNDYLLRALFQLDDWLWKTATNFLLCWIYSCTLICDVY